MANFLMLLDIVGVHYISSTWDIRICKNNEWSISSGNITNIYSNNSPTNNEDLKKICQSIASRDTTDKKYTSRSHVSKIIINLLFIKISLFPRVAHGGFFSILSVWFWNFRNHKSISDCLLIGNK